MAEAIANGAAVDCRITYAARTPLMVASIHGKGSAAAFLLANGADPLALDTKGLTAADLARQCHHPELEQLVRESARAAR